MAILKESIENKEIEELVHVSGKQMLADGLTKKGASTKKLLDVMKNGMTS